MRTCLLLALLATVSAFAQPRSVIPEHYYRTFSHTNPVFVRIKPGDLVATKTLDSGGQNERNEQLSPAAIH